ncbi:MAG: hypothetical protein ACKO41_05605 [Sphingomonadales bacterium]
MSRYHAYLKKAVAILQAYKGQEPFSIFCKQQFSLDRKMGSTDRRWVRHYCYCYFRMGKAVCFTSAEERILAGLFLCNKTEDALLAQERPEWNLAIHKSITEKLLMIDQHSLIDQVFPYRQWLSASLKDSPWTMSLWEQPALFIRLRPGKEQQVRDALKAQSISFESLEESTLRLPATTALTSWPGLNRDFVIQDLSSQHIGSMLSLLPVESKANCWDCCAGSGGKTLLAYDVLGPIHFTVSDKRPSILQQLENRFAQAAITDYRSRMLDLSRPLPTGFSDNFSFIWADVPCTGSGTWSRTPEQLCFFQPTSISDLQQLQRSILHTALQRLQPNGYLLYSTCSVFFQENEEQIVWLEKEMGLECIQQQLFDGSSKQADSLYAALLKKRV